MSETTPERLYRSEQDRLRPRGTALSMGRTRHRRGCRLTQELTRQYSAVFSDARFVESLGKMQNHSANRHHSYVCKTSIPGSNPGGASKITQQKRMIDPDDDSQTVKNGRKWTY